MVNKQVVLNGFYEASKEEYFEFTAQKGLPHAVLYNFEDIGTQEFCTITNTFSFPARRMQARTRRRGKVCFHRNGVRHITATSNLKMKCAER